MIINLISGPRNISTALMYSFAQRHDVQVVDEPLYAHYLRVSGVDHPGRTEILNAQSADGKQVSQAWLRHPSGAPHLFLKNMGHHFVALDLKVLLKTQNILLIRDPKEVLASFGKVIAQPSLTDIGIVRQAELYHYLVAHGRPPVVLRGNDVRRQPKSMLRKLCEALSLPFDPLMLQWEAGPRSEDGVWAPYWYKQVHQSTSFLPYTPSRTELKAHLVSVALEAQPYYEQLAEVALTDEADLENRQN